MFLLQSRTLTDSSTGETSTYPPLNKLPLLKYLPTKLAEFIGNNFRDELKLPSTIPRLHNQWTVNELNFILLNCLVKEERDGTHLRTFGAIEWESELREGTPRAKCYTLKEIYGKNVQVFILARRNIS